MLRLDGVHTYYGNIHALKGISFEVAEGQIGCLIGANGAGKSTTLMTISGIERARQGVVEFMGEPIQRVPPEQIVRRGISQVPEGRRVFTRLTVRENLLLGSYTRTDKAGIEKDLERVLSRFQRLAERIDQDGGTLSGGEQQMLAIGRAMMARPKLMLLDEPSLGLAPLVVETIFEIIAEIVKENITVLLVEQNANAALVLADYGWVLETGRIALRDEAKALLENPKVRQTYLGEE